MLLCQSGRAESGSLDPFASLFAPEADSKKHYLKALGQSTAAADVARNALTAAPSQQTHFAPIDALVG